MFRFKLDVVSLPVALNKTTTCTSRHHQAYLTWGTSPPHAHRHGEQHHHHMHHQTYLKHEQHHHLHHNNHTAFEFWRPDLSFYHILVPIGYRATALSDASVCLSVTLLPPETRGYVLWGVGRGLVNKHAFFLLLGLRVGRAGGHYYIYRPSGRTILHMTCGARNFKKYFKNTLKHTLKNTLKIF